MLGMAFPGNYQFNCQECSMTFNEAAELEEHEKVQHNKEKAASSNYPSTFECDEGYFLDITSENLSEINLFEEDYLERFSNL